MRIFLTGATGVVGRRVVPLFAAGGHDVTAVVRSPEKAPALMRAGARQTVSVDLFDEKAVRRALAGHDVVVNLATHVPHTATRTFLPGAWRENDRIRLLASRILADAALELGVQRFVQESFALAYADHGANWIDESAPLMPERYNKTVCDAERAALLVSGSGRTGVALRFGAFYGPDSLLLRGMVRMVQHGVAPVVGRPEAYISMISHHDAATATMTSLDLPAGAYNVVDDEPLTHREFADTLAEAVGARHPRLPPDWVTVLGGSVARTMARSLRVANTKLRASGWEPKFPSAREGWTEAVRGSMKPGRTDGGDLFPSEPHHSTR
jgi:nucleoside-diphosphate-sugar epimerase